MNGVGPCALCEHDPACGSASVQRDEEIVYLCHEDDHSCYHEWTVYGRRTPRRTDVPEHWADKAEEWWQHVRDCSSCSHHFQPPAA